MPTVFNRYQYVLEVAQTSPNRTLKLYLWLVETVRISNVSLNTNNADGTINVKACVVHRASRQTNAVTWRRALCAWETLRRSLRRFMNTKGQ